MDNFEKNIRLRDAALGRVPADLVIKNGTLVNVYTQELYRTDVAIVDDIIVGLGTYEGREEIDASGLLIAPGFIDAHIHIESSLVTPDVLNDILVPRGVLSIIADPHEIANVAGVEGIEYMRTASRGLELDVYLMLPSCVPATPLDHAGATLRATDLASLYEREGVLGLGEVMDAFAVYSDEDMLHKVTDAAIAGRRADGHGSILDENGLNTYATLGIATDHETVDISGMQERLRRGLYVHIREGTVAKNLATLLPGVTADNYRRVCLCTDDRHLDDLVATGGLDEAVRLAVREGMPIARAITCASLNAAECYGLTGRGAIAPGYFADIVALDEKTLHAVYVWKNGKQAAMGGIPTQKRGGTAQQPAHILNTVRCAPVDAHSLDLPAGKNATMHIIGVEGGNLLTEHLVEEVSVSDGLFVASRVREHAKLAVIERHHATGNIALCPVKGMRMRAGALAASVAHDSHNIIVVGMKDEDMLLAISELERMGGGYVVAKEGKVLAALPLEVAGLMTTAQPQEVLEKLEALHHAAAEIMDADFNPFQMLSFLSLPVIPELKLVDSGLVDVRNFKIIAPQAE